MDHNKQLEEAENANRILTEQDIETEKTAWNKAIEKYGDRINLDALKETRSSARHDENIPIKRKLNISMDPTTFQLLSDYIPIGEPGIGVGSAFLDIGARLLLGIITDDPGLIPEAADQLIKLSANPRYAERGAVHLLQALEKKLGA